MYRCISKSLDKSRQLQILRTISSAEIAAALRPFYFVVHPDLFGRFPEQRAVNEDSLKHLSAHLEALQRRRLLNATPASLPFYVRASDNAKKGTFKLIYVPVLRHADPKKVLTRILQACELPTDYVDKIEAEARPLETTAPNYRGYRPDDFKYGKDFESYKEYESVRRETEAARDEKSLKSWMKNNLETAKTRTEAMRGIRDDVDKLKEQVVQRFGLKELRYDCGWNIEHFRGCIKSLERIANLHNSDMEILKGRTLVFAPFTGVSLDGHIMLYTGDVQRNWIEFIKKIPQQDLPLKKIPAYEFALAQVLRKIRIGRRKFMPKIQAVDYTAQLRKVTTNLLDYLSKHKYPESWPESLSEYEFVVEPESGPLMVNPTGQIISPSSCPGHLLVDFITNNLEKALQYSNEYKKLKYVERDLHNETIDALGLLSLQKDDSVTPDRMIKCLETIRQSSLDFSGVNLHITHYYSVLSDGIVCIPWNCKIE